MNTATQLLERCKTLAESALDNAEELLNDHLAKYGENYKPHRAAEYRAEIQEAKNALKDIEAYLAKQQVEQEPIGTVRQANGCTYIEWNHVPPEAGTICYATPQAREHLSEGDIYKIFKRCRLGVNGCTEFARAIEAHHGIK